MRAAIANERSIRAENSQAHTNAQITQAQQAQADARNAQELLQALQAQNAIVQGQTAQAQALAQVEIAKTIAEASRTNYTPLYAILVAAVVIVLALYGPRPRNAMKLLFRSAHAEAWLLPDGSIHLCRLRDGKIKLVKPGHEMHTWLLTGGK